MMAYNDEIVRSDKKRGRGRPRKLNEPAPKPDSPEEIHPLPEKMTITDPEKLKERADQIAESYSEPPSEVSSSKVEPEPSCLGCPFGTELKEGEFECRLNQRPWKFPPKRAARHWCGHHPEIAKRAHG